jgi:RNA polymerase sigma-70 factor (ECF subfamily)
MTTIEEIYRAHSDDVYRFACWLGGDVAEAEDIVSETFLRLWGSLDEVRVGTVKAYLFVIARNVFVSRRRRSQRYRQLPQKISDDSPPPDVRAEQQDEMRALMDAVQTLPEGERAAFLMRIQHELPYTEIARSLEISLSAAKVRVHRARVKLAQLRSISGDERCM